MEQLKVRVLLMLINTIISIKNMSAQVNNQHLDAKEQGIVAIAD